MKHWYNHIENTFSTFAADVQVLHLVSDLKKAENLSASAPESAENHLFRALILLDYIISDPKWNRKLRELLRLREVIGSLIVLSEPYGSYRSTIRAALFLEPGAYRTLKEYHSP
jgi:hypothetical protein